MLDAEIFGVHPGGFHLTNLIFHLVNSLVLFFLLKSLTGARWKSAFVACLFAFHPLRVESVAWVSERKDVLYAFFWLLSMNAYHLYTRSKTRRHYILLVLCFCLSVMAKPMAVTLPFVLLLLDFWPLNRMEPLQTEYTGHRAVSLNGLFRNMNLQKHLIIEKIPLFIIVIVVCVMTIMQNRTFGALISLEDFPVDIRIGNAVVSYAKYVWMMFWPHPLVVFYPHPGRSLPLWQINIAGIFILAVTLGIMRTLRTHPYLSVGWLWFLGTLLPVIGLFQSGTQELADRFTYVPLLGLFFGIAWTIASLFNDRRHQKPILIAIVGLMIPLMIIKSYDQTRLWKNSITLFEYTLKNTDDSFLVNKAMAEELFRMGDIEKGIVHFKEAGRINPLFPSDLFIGNSLFFQKKYEQAIFHYRKALVRKPTADIYRNIGHAYHRLKKLSKTISYYQKALEMKENADIHYDLAMTYEETHQVNQAIKHYRKALALKPLFPESHFNLGNIYYEKRELDLAINHYRMAIHQKPDYAGAHNNLANVMLNVNRLDEAIAHYNRALQIDPGFEAAKRNRHIALQKQKAQSNSSKDEIK